MFREPSHSYLRRDLHTSEPRFKRLSKTNTIDSDMKKTLHHNFPSVNRGNAFDNSKENLHYQSYLTKVRSACKLDETTIVSKYLNTIRKDYDDMNKDSKKQIMGMRIKKKDIEFMKMKNRVFAQRREEIQQKIAEKQKETHEFKTRYEDAKMETKTLENIISRMKKDQIFYKQFGRIRDEELKKRQKEVKFIEEGLIHQDQKMHKLIANLNQCKGLYMKNKEIREKKFEDFSGKISDVRERDKFIQERKERTYELQSIELNDTLDEKNIHMREIILAHKVADSLLESKVNSLIKKYSDIQGAFHLVKIKTGISEPQLLTTKFFSYQQTAESLLESINIHERKIEELLKKKEMLSSKHRELINQSLSATDKDQVTCSSMHSQNKDTLIKQINFNHLLIDQIHTWIHKKLLAFQSEDGNKAVQQKKFKILCDLVLENANKYNNCDFPDKKMQTMGVRLKKFVKEMSSEQLSYRVRQTEDMNESNYIEEEFIKTSRQSVLKQSFSIKHFRRQSKVLNK